MATVYKNAFFEDKIVPIEEANLSIASSAVLYGLSVYTVFPVIKQLKKRGGFQAFRLNEHYARLLNSAKIIGIDTFEEHWSYKKFLKAVSEVVKANVLPERVFLRATVHVNELVPGTRSRGLKTTLSIFAYEAKPIVPQNGARLKTSVWRRVPDISIPSRAKVNGAYVNSVLAKQDAIDSGYDDCIFLDTLGHVCELSAANIFLVRGGVLITPDSAGDILIGINRKTILELAREMKIPTVERTIDFTELYIADEAFACGTSAFIAPIIEIDGRKIGARAPGPLTLKIKKKYEAIFSGKGPGYKGYFQALD